MQRRVSGLSWVFVCLFEVSIVHIHVSRTEEFFKMLLTERLPFVVIIRSNLGIKLTEPALDSREYDGIKELLTISCSDRDRKSVV